MLRTIHRLSELTLLLCRHTIIIRMSVILVYGVVRCMTRISNILNRESSTHALYLHAAKKVPRDLHFSAFHFDKK